MKALTLTTFEHSHIKAIQKKLAQRTALADQELSLLIEFISQIPDSYAELLPIIPLCDEIQVLKGDSSQKILEEWQYLFCNIPGFDCAPNCYILDNDSKELLTQDVIMIAVFTPSLAYNKIASNEGYEIRFKTDCTASFWFPTFEDAVQYPELFNFKGTWKEAYYLLIKTLKKSWPMEEFPEELKPLLKKEN